MQITIRYGVDSIAKTIEAHTTIGDLRNDDSLQAALGYGDNTNWLINGVQMGESTRFSPNQVVVVETAANTKA